MAQAQSLDYNSIENELGFDMSQLGGQSFHADNSDHSKTLEDEVNNNNGTTFQNLSSSWLSDFTSVGNGERFGCNDVDNEMISGASEGFPNKTDSENLANGLSISYLNNWMVDTPLNKLLATHTSFTGNQSADTNNGQIIGDDFVLSNLDHLMNENKISPNEQKATETLTNCDEIDSFMEAFDEIREQDIRDRPVELLNFGMSKPKQSDLVGLSRKRKNIECIQTDPKRKRTKISDTVGAGEFITTNLASSKATMQLSKETGRGRNRNAKTRNRRGEAGFATDFEDLSPVSSPEAEVPRSPMKTNELIDDDELVTLETKDLNKRVKYLPRAMVWEIKHRRRTLKNRGYARSCREKKIGETSCLQKSNTDLEKELASKSLELQVVKIQCKELKRKYEQLASACKARGIKVH